MKRYIKSAKDFPHALADVCEQNGWLDLYDGGKKNDFYYLVKQGIGLDEVSHLIWLGTSDASLSYHDIYDVIKDISEVKASKRTRKSAIKAAWEPAFSDGWSEEDIELWKSIDWKARNYEVYPVDDDTYLGTVSIYGIYDFPVRRAARFIKMLRANPIYPPYYSPDPQSESDILNEFSEEYQIVGPMVDGKKYHGYGVANRYETQEVYDLSFD